MLSPRARFVSIVVLALLLPARSDAQSRPSRDVQGSLVSVSVQVAGRPAPLYAAPDGSDRWYLEAREGSAYAVTVTNRTSERLGVVVAVDGLNAISGQRQRRPSWWQAADPGRMYVLEPWGLATVQGWRTSLDDVRRFTFVDEQLSYAARSGKSNGRMGWIEIAVFRERERGGLVTPARPGRVSPDGESGARDESAARSQAPAPEAAPSDPAAAEPQGPAESQESRPDLARGAAGRARSYPGTGWGPEAVDRVVVVEFEPERRPAERVTLRYEYAPALVALGVLPRGGQDGGRLAERDLGERDFAPVPLW